MIKKVNSLSECKICDNYLTLLIQDERKYDNSIDKNFVVKDYFINMINKDNILLLYKDLDVYKGYVFAKKIDNTYLIDGIYVDVKFRNSGIATRLLKEIINMINLRGTYKIYINVLKANKKAINLYKKLGFSINESIGIKYYMEYKKY